MAKADPHEVTTQDGFPGAVVERRMGMGMSLDALARAADVTVAQLTAVEGGEVPTTEIRASMCRVPELQTTPDPRIHPISPDHAEMLLLLDRGMGKHGGTALASDVVAWKASLGRLPNGSAPRPMAHAIQKTLLNVPVGVAITFAITFAIIPASLTFAIVPASFMGNMTLMKHVLLAVGSGCIMAVAAAIVGLLCTAWENRMRWRATKLANGVEQAASSRLREETTKRAACEEEMTHAALIVTPDGVVVADVRDRSENRLEPIGSNEVYEVRAERVSRSHATVSFATASGHLSVAWVRWSDDVADALRRLVVGSGAPWRPKLVLPSPETMSLPRLDGEVT